MKHTVEEVKAKIQEFRTDYHAGRLTPYQIEQFEAIPGWTWDVDAPIPEPKPHSLAMIASHGPSAMNVQPVYVKVQRSCRCGWFNSDRAD